MDPLKTCSRCGAEKPRADFSKNKNKPDGLRCECKACVSKYMAAYVALNREANAKRAKNWRLANPERFKAVLQKATRRWYEKNKERVNKASRERQAAIDPDVRRAQHRAYYANNSEKLCAKARVHMHKRRAAKIGSLGTHTKDEIALLYSRQKGCCAYCKVKLNSKFQIDHKTALMRGGSNDILNIQILCAKCNMKKKAKDPIVFAQSIGLLL